MNWLAEKPSESTTGCEPFGSGSGIPVSHGALLASTVAGCDGGAGGASPPQVFWQKRAGQRPLRTASQIDGETARAKCCTTTPATVLSCAWPRDRPNLLGSPVLLVPMVKGRHG